MKTFIQTIRRNGYLVGTVVLLLLSLAFTATILSVLPLAMTPDETQIGYLYLGGVEKEAYGDVIKSAMTTWKSQARYTLEYQNEALELDVSLWTYQEDETLEGIVPNELNSVVFSLSDSNRQVLINQLESAFSDELVTHLDVDNLLLDIEDNLSQLAIAKTYSVINYVEASYSQVINSVTIDQLTEADIDHIIALDNQITFEPNQRYSLLSDFEGILMTNEQLSIIASGIQALTANTALSTYLFEPMPLMPAWAEAGMNVRILQVNQFDFSLYNPLENQLTVEFEKISATELRLNLTGIPYIATYETNPVLIQTVPFDETMVLDETLTLATPGIEIIEDTDEETLIRLLISDGTNGSITSFIRTTTLLDGTVQTIALYDEEIKAIDAVYSYNSIPKGGD